MKKCDFDWQFFISFVFTHFLSKFYNNGGFPNLKPGLSNCEGVISICPIFSRSLQSLITFFDKPCIVINSTLTSTVVLLVISVGVIYTLPYLNNVSIKLCDSFLVLCNMF